VNYPFQHKCSICGAWWIVAHSCPKGPVVAEAKGMLSHGLLEQRVSDMEAELAKLRSDLAVATKLLRYVADREINHSVLCPGPVCACGAEDLTTRIETFVDQCNLDPRAQGGGSAGRPVE